ncbi:zinc finger protein 883-like isoform X2 [Chrysoperla carnea]|uniref:zinc finger protein 883-like isoform X2 n=1 Tax=Chrysoperla carnea TaxID=189513 RepID=UPI001D05DF55|nr:zinc finger protein 883-like isoform X2 [Chrysoperla carnea]
MDTCLMADFEKVCRICMKFDETFLSINTFKIIDMIVACASVQIWENDDLPNQICNACFLQLKNAMNFKQLCESSDNAFRQIIEQNKINLSNNYSHFVNVKDEEFDGDYTDINSQIYIKEEDISEGVTNENTLENVKITSDCDENDSKISETKNILEITNKDRSEVNGLQMPTKSDELSDNNENIIKVDSNVIETSTCEKCNREHSNVWALSQHMRRKHRVKPIKCNKCNQKYYHPLTLKRHEQSKHKPLVNHICNLCNKTFKSVKRLNNHNERCPKLMGVHSDLEQFVTCHICGKLTRKQSIRNHLLIHKERHKVSCDICSKTFICKASFKKHIREVHENQIPDRKHLCNICGYASSRVADLRRHLLTHSTERPYVCEHCDKTYKTAESLKEHISHVHFDVRKYQCSFCSQAFHKRRTLVNHERRHTGEKPHKCEVCGKGFAQNTALKIHTKIHTNSKENLTRS